MEMEKPGRKGHDDMNNRNRSRKNVYDKNAFGNVLGWEAKKCFYKLRMILIPFLAALLLVCLLPGEICQFLDQRMRPAVAFVNLFLGLSMGIGFSIFPFWWMVYPYGDPYYDMERISDVSTGARILARILINMIIAAVFMGVTELVTEAMGKFAGANHSWLQVNVTWGPSYMILIHGLLGPLAYLFFFLRRYVMDGEKSYIVPYIFSSLVTAVFRGEGKDLSGIHFGQIELPHWSGVGLWVVIVLLVSGFFFVRCVQMERKEFEFWE